MSLSVNRIGYAPANLVSLKSNDVNFQGQKSDVKSSKDEGMGTFANVMLGATALAATAAIFVATKGKVKAPQKPDVSTILPQNLSHLDIDLFKKFGKFEKGKAFLNGKEFSGIIYTKNGCELKYSCGELDKAITPKSKKYYYKGKLYAIDHKYQWVGDVKSTKIDRLQDGTKVITKRRGGYDQKFLDENVPVENNHDIITTIKPDGTITRLTKNIERNDKLGKKFTYDKLEDLNTGKVSLTKKKVEKNKYFDLSSSNSKRRVVIDGKKVSQELNPKGEVVRSWTTEYNPKTGISTQKIEHMERPEFSKYETIMRDKKGNKIIYCAGQYSLYDSKGMYRSPSYDHFLFKKDEMQKIIKEKGLSFKI